MDRKEMGSVNNVLGLALSVLVFIFDPVNKLNCKFDAFNSFLHVCSAYTRLYTFRQQQISKSGHSSNNNAWFR